MEVYLLLSSTGMKNKKSRADYPYTVRI